MVGNLCCALAPSYELLIGARIVTAFCHAAFFGIAAIVAADLVPAGRRTQAIALVFAGLTVANILGVPGGTSLGSLLGWRATFIAVAVIGVLAMTLMILWLPRHLPAPRGDLRAEFRVLLRPQVLLAMSTTVLASAALFTVFTFVAPLLGETTGLSVTGISWLLLVFGVGMTAGSFIGGRLADWNLPATILGTLAAVGVVLALLPLLAPYAIATYVLFFVWGLVGFAMAPALQMRVMQAAGDAPTAASTLNQAAFNLGNAGGATLGAAALALGLDYVQLPLLSVAIICTALLVTAMSVVLERRQLRRSLMQTVDLLGGDPPAQPA